MMPCVVANKKEQQVDIHAIEISVGDVRAYRLFVPPPAAAWHSA